MVKVELVADDVAVPLSTDDKNFYEEFSEEEEFVEEDDEFDVNETFTERIIALKDVVPPNYRSKISGTFGALTSVIQSTFSVGGKSLWAIVSSTLLLGIPLSLCILQEQQLIEMKKGMQLPDSTNSVLAPGAEGSFTEPTASPRA